MTVPDGVGAARPSERTVLAWVRHAPSEATATTRIRSVPVNDDFCEYVFDRTALVTPSSVHLLYTVPSKGLFSGSTSDGPGDVGSARRELRVRDLAYAPVSETMYMIDVCR